MPEPLIPGSDPGACPDCGAWRKAGTAHTCAAPVGQSENLGIMPGGFFARLLVDPNTGEEQRRASSSNPDCPVHGEAETNSPEEGC